MNRREVKNVYHQRKRLCDAGYPRIDVAIDPDMSIIECLNGTYQCPRNGQDGVPCHAHDELQEIQDQLWTMLRRKSMKDLFGKEEK